MWTGKIVGGLIGFVLLSPLGLSLLGAALGVYLGNNYDRGTSSTFGLGQNTHPDSQRLFFESLFRLLGHLAKADGRISEEEVAHAEQLMTQSGLNTSTRQQAIGEFQRGASPEFNLQQQLAEFNEVCGRNARLKQTLLAYLVTMALADGHLDESERQVLDAVCNALGLPAFVLDQLIRMIGAQAHFRSGNQQSGQRPSSQNELKMAYEALGVEASATDAQIKKAYRKLMSENHPDKLMGQGVPEDMVKLATERSKEISKAFDLIKDFRKS